MPNYNSSLLSCDSKMGKNIFPFFIRSRKFRRPQKVFNITVWDQFCLKKKNKKRKKLIKALNDNSHSVYLFLYHKSQGFYVLHFATPPLLSPTPNSLSPEPIYLRLKLISLIKG